MPDKETCMDLILWRHAEAMDGSPDLARKLTAKGEKQAKQAAAWLRSRLPDDARILVSPAQRTLQTARALTEQFEVAESIAPGASPSSVLRAADWPDAGGTVLVVGHQPTLGIVAALLVAGKPMPWSLRKGGIWWLSRRARGGEDQVVVRAVIAPDLL
jgi:phosphohistidine phosphatase